MLWLVGGVLEVGTIEPGGVHADPLQELLEENANALASCNQTGQRQTVHVQMRLEQGTPRTLILDGPEDLASCVRGVLMAIEYDTDPLEVSFPLDLVPLQGPTPTDTGKGAERAPGLTVQSVSAKDQPRAERVVERKKHQAAPCVAGIRSSGTVVVSNTRGVLENETGDLALGECMAAQVSDWPFPPDAGAEIVITFHVQEDP